MLRLHAPSLSRFRRPALLGAATLALTACANAPRSAEGVVRWTDGMFKATSAAQAEAFCRMDGSPVRFVEPAEVALRPDGSVLFRCD